MIKYLLYVLIMPTLFFIPVEWTSATSTREKSQPMEASKVVVQVDQRLRSAFLHRAVESGTYRSVMPVDKNIAELRRHFDAVLEILKANEMRALQISLNRLEEIQGKSWTIADRSLWREELSKRRSVQITRLELYRERGLFPQNEHANHTVPVFVDNYGTDCAVGHLMRESGAGELVDLVARTNNLVYVSDVFGGAMVQWIAHSGLTQEEAALIQPGYPNPAPDASFEELGSTGSISHGGLRYDNFDIIAGYVVIPGLQIDQNNFFPIDLQKDRIYVSADNMIHNGAAMYGEYYPMTTVFEDWLYVGSAGSILPHHIYDQGIPQIQLVYSYLVSADTPGGMISGAAFNLQPIYNFNSLGYTNNETEDEPRIAIQTVIYSKNSILSFLEYDTGEYDDDSSSFIFGSESSVFEPQESIYVRTSVTLNRPATFASMNHSFLLQVPEPSTMSMFMLSALAIIGWKRWC